MLDDKLKNIIYGIGVDYLSKKSMAEALTNFKDAFYEEFLKALEGHEFKTNRTNRENVLNAIDDCRVIVRELK